MPRRYSTADIVRALERLGFTRTRQRGSHIRYSGRWRGGTRHVSVVANVRVIKPGTLTSMLQQAGITRAELDQLLEGEQISE